jgi:antitoxin ParD1/3/4
MNITLGNEFERRIAEKVNTGLYSSSSEVIREGLRLLFERDAIREQQLSILQREVAAGFWQLDAAQINSQSVAAIFDKELSKPL